jgi:uncharacterized membrane protein
MNTSSDTPSTDNDSSDPDAFVAHHPPERLALIERLRIVCVAALAGLIVLGVTWELWLAPLPGGTGMLALKVLPLCLGVTGLLKHRLYTYRWLTLLIWLYFTEGIVRLTGDACMSQLLAGVEIAFSMVLFTACSVYIRLRLRVLPRKTKSSDTP